MDTIDPCPDYIATYALAIEMARDGDERVRAFFRGECKKHDHDDDEDKG